MRISIDIDERNPLRLGLTIVKGILICKKFPKKIRFTKRGYHVVWQGLNIDEETMYKYRLKIGDDPNRILLDMICVKKPKQVLFKSKDVYIYEYDSFGNFERKIKIQ